MPLYGVTHTPAGKPIVRLAKTLKVGIGYPKGKAIHVYIDARGKWCVETGDHKDTRKVARFDDRAKAQDFYREAWPKTADRRYPAKFGYFTFQRISIDGSFSPDWDAIELHGPLPTEVPIVFLDNAPLHQQFEWWTAAELKCSGDGRTAMRRCSAAKTKEEKAAAEEAAARGENVFPILDACFTQGCVYAKGEKPLCKPHTRLSFQLANAPALGSTCHFDSTGFRSASQLFSSLEQIRAITGRGNPEEGPVAGIPLLLKLLPYKTSHQGKPSTQFGVTLHLRAKDAMDLMRGTLQRADEFRQLQVAPLMLSAAQEEAPEEALSDAVDADVIHGEVLPESAEAAAMEAEFYPEGENPDDFEIVEEPAEAEMPQIRRKSAAAAESAAPVSEPADPAPEAAHDGPVDDWGDPIREASGPLFDQAPEPKKGKTR